MLKNYLKIAVRNITRYRGYSLINVLGLSIGMAGILLVFLYVGNELSYDRFHEHSKDIYRVEQLESFGNSQRLNTFCPTPLAETIMKEIDEVEYATRFSEGINTVLWYQNKSFFETTYLYVDDNFLKVFSYPLIKGNPKTVLKKPGSVIITKSMAKKYFRDEDPLGKVLHEVDGTDYTVTGIIDDVPANTHIRFDFIASLNTYPWTQDPDWLRDGYFTYLLAKKGAKEEDIKTGLNKIKEKYLYPELEKRLGLDIKKKGKLGNELTYQLEPLTRIYLYSEAEPQVQEVSDFRTTYLFAIISLFILIQALFNFSGLTTASANTRAREIGMRKAMGSHRWQVFTQLLIESVVFSFLAMIVALVIVELFLPLFNKLVVKELSMSYFKEWFVIPLLALITLLIGLAAGSYSSWSISSYKATNTLYGKYKLKGSKKSLRTGMVVFQFFIAMVVVISTIVIYSHIHYITKKDPGFNKENLLVVDRAYGLDDGIKSFMMELNSHPSINKLCVTSNVPGMEDWMGMVFRKEGAEKEDLIHFKRLVGSCRLDSTLGLRMVAGEYINLKKYKETGIPQILINETAARNLGYEDPVGKRLVLPGSSEGKEWVFEISGMVEDFHMTRMNREIDNLAIFMESKFKTPRYVVLRYDGEKQSEVLNFVKDTWRDYAINQPFSYHFMDDLVIHMQFSERRTASIFAIFALVALVIAGMGIFSLAAYTTETRTREISIRKAMGSSSGQVTQLFLREYFKWIIAATLLGWPAAWFVMNRWLDHFPYHGNFPWWALLISASFMALIAFLSVALQTSRAAMKNPVHSIRYE